MLVANNNYRQIINAHNLLKKDKSYEQVLLKGTQRSDNFFVVNFSNTIKLRCIANFITERLVIILKHIK